MCSDWTSSFWPKNTRKLKFSKKKNGEEKGFLLQAFLTLYVPIIAILDIWKTTLFYEGESVVYDGLKYVWPVKG